MPRFVQSSSPLLRPRGCRHADKSQCSWSVPLNRAGALAGALLAAWSLPTLTQAAGLCAVLGLVLVLAREN